ncbi:hypothetical protein EXIGLDRAFT_96247 [Exidia glandulosa HHB12029]|uniref:Uncharacterized protein n=1 Tax=Exidia glandulosa HHB12029 TaxID=1314781 RepID=A0A166ME59_EXIGL|nr:hypothetical protein EXIGLDRAFT_96247 [Exidia glandulosa HHB12029]
MWKRQRRKRAESHDEDWFAIPTHSQLKAGQYEATPMSPLSPGSNAHSPSRIASMQYPQVPHQHMGPAYDPALYAAQAQDFYGGFHGGGGGSEYPADVKQQPVLNVMSAETDVAPAPAPVSRAAESSSRPAAPEVPTQLTAEEMEQLAELVARRMTAHMVDDDDMEPPPMYR